ncbi:hypothetical protein T484DRAFT_1604051, partial [Baffinella frigidus]
CAECAVNTYSHEPAAASCKRCCAVNTYSDAPASASCTACPENSNSRYGWMLC